MQAVTAVTDLIWGPSDKKQKQTLTEWFYDLVLDETNALLTDVKEDVELDIKRSITKLVEEQKLTIKDIVKHPHKYIGQLPQFAAAFADKLKADDTDDSGEEYETVDNTASHKVEIKMKRLAKSKATTVPAVSTMPTIPQPDQTVKVFKQIYQRSSNIIKRRCKNGRAEFRILSIGPTQIGKTSTIKNLLKVDIKIGKNTESDTDKISEYTKVFDNDGYSIDFIYADTPGFFDSRDRDDKHFEELCAYIRNNKIHVILFFAKFTDIIDGKYRELFAKLVTKFGTGFLNKTMVVLTRAMDGIPIEYYPEADMSMAFADSPELDQINKQFAWINYRDAKISMWNTYFISTFKCDIPIIIVENNKYQVCVKDGEYVLPDNTAMWATFLAEIFLLLSYDDSSLVLQIAAAKQDADDKLSNQNKIVYNAFETVMEMGNQTESSPPITEYVNGPSLLLQSQSQPYVNVNPASKHKSWCTIL
jgi:hypothetical protein